MGKEQGCPLQRGIADILAVECGFFLLRVGFWPCGTRCHILIYEDILLLSRAEWDLFRKLAV